MTVGQLKKKIEIMPDNWQVLMPASDHSYRPVDAAVEIVEKDGKGYFGEPADSDDPAEGMTNEQALIIS